MQAIGIDHQMTMSVACLCESVGGRPASIRSIGDGASDLVLHYALPDHRWSGRAVSDVHGTRLPGWSPDGAHQWSDEEQRLFWSGFAGRLTSFLGRPINDKGIDIGLSVMVDVESELNGSGIPIAKSELQTVRLIHATTALASRWLTSNHDTFEFTARIVVVVVGDNRVAVTPILIRKERRKWEFRPTGSPKYLDGAGLAFWIEHLIRELEQQTSEPGRQASLGLSIHRAAIEFGARLFEAKRSDPVAWKGPLRDRFYLGQSFERTREDINTWSPVLKLRTELPGMIRTAASSFDHDEHPVRVILGGVGLCWPVLETDLFAGMGAECWFSPNPIHDVAIGAATWVGERERFELINDQSLLPDTSEPTISSSGSDWTAPDSWVSSAPLAEQVDVPVPPWMRRSAPTEV